MPPKKPNFSLDYLYKQMLGAKLEVPKEFKRKPEIRASSLPFCGRKFVFQYYEYLYSTGMQEYSSSFYCDIGTTVHSAIQFWLPIANPGAILGSWKCSICGKLYEGRPGPVFCCNYPTKYEEFEAIAPDAPVSMHCDGIFIDLVNNPDITPDKVLKFIRKPRNRKIQARVVDYKTTSMRKLSAIREPQLAHRCQASFYVSSFRRMLPIKYDIHNLDIVGFVIKYVTRDNHFMVGPDLEVDVPDDKFYTNTCKVVNKTLKSLKASNSSWLKTFKCCEKWPDIHGDCAYRDLCHPLSVKDFKEMFKAVSEHFNSSRKK